MEYFKNFERTSPNIQEPFKTAQTLKTAWLPTNCIFWQKLSVWAKTSQKSPYVFLILINKGVSKIISYNKILLIFFGPLCKMLFVKVGKQIIDDLVSYQKTVTCNSDLWNGICKRKFYLTMNWMRLTINCWIMQIEENVQCTASMQGYH